MRASGVFNKNRLHKYTIIGIKQLQKRNVTTLNSAAHIKQKRCATCRSGYNDSRVLFIASSESCRPSISLFGVGRKSKESIFKSNNQTNSTVTTRTWVLSKEWLRTWPTDWYPNEKMVVPVYLNGRHYSSRCVGIVLY